MNDFWALKVRSKLTPWMVTVTIGAAMVQLAFLAFDYSGASTSIAVLTLVLVVIALIPIEPVQQGMVTLIDLVAVSAGMQALANGSTCIEPASPGQRLIVFLASTIAIGGVVSGRLFSGSRFLTKPIETGLAFVGALFASTSLALLMAESDTTGRQFLNDTGFTALVLGGSLVVGVLMGLWPEFTSWVVGVGVLAAAIVMSMLIPNPCRPPGPTLAVLVTITAVWAVASGAVGRHLKERCRDRGDDD